MASIDNDMNIDQTWSEKLIAKGRKSPFLVASVVTLVGACGYGIYGFKKKKISTQMYLLQFRVTAQGAAIACLTAGMVYHMVRKYVLHKEDEP